MFELSIALKYLIPRKKHLSVTLIAMMSVTVISLIVWLLLVFLSVTEGMEKNWLKKLTDLNAPIRITPTPDYFSSYYYKIDSLSGESNYSLKTLEEKQNSNLSDPYNPEEDPELPSYFPKPHIDSNGQLIDPVKRLQKILTTLKQEEKSLLFQDYEMSGATLKLQLLRNRSPSPFCSGQESLNFLTQVSYLSTPPASSTILSPLLIRPSLQDIEHLFFLAGYRLENTLSNEAPDLTLNDSFQERVTNLLDCIQITSVKTVPPHFTLPLSLLPKNRSFTVYGLFKGEHLVRLILPLKPSSSPNLKMSQGLSLRIGTLLDNQITFQGSSYPTPSNLVSLDAPLTFNTKVDLESIKKARTLQDLRFFIKTAIQGHAIEGKLPWKDLTIETFSVKDLPQAPWAHADGDAMILPLGPCGETGILAPKAFKDNGVLVGDKGFLSYTSSTASALQEQRTAVIVVGFYDPGVISIGNKCLLVPKTITRTINASNTSLTFDKIALNGFQVWLDPAKALPMKKKIEKALYEQELDRYFQVLSFQEYDFAKDLLEQFQSDKYLFSLVGFIILFVACCNILSFLILLVNDKKKEIAILQAMGASKKSIACIFGFAGVVIGGIGSILGIAAAVLTLHNIDTLVALLSALQGHDAFHQTFYGSSLPNALSSHALLFTVIATPILSLAAGLIPALKACRLHPSSILRSES